MLCSCFNLYKSLLANEKEDYEASKGIGGRRGCRELQGIKSTESLYMRENAV